MELIKLQRERSPVPPMMASGNVRTTDGPGALIDPIIHHTCIKQPITTPNLVSTQTQPLTYTSVVHHDSAQTHTCNVLSAKTISPDPNKLQTNRRRCFLFFRLRNDVPLGNTTLEQSPDQHDDVTSSEYTSLAHQDSAQTNTYDVPLGNTTLELSPDQHDDVTSSEYTSLAHQDSAQTNTYDVPLGNTTLEQSPDQHDDVASSEYTSLAHQDSAQTNTYDVPLGNTTLEQSPDQHDDDNSSGYMNTSLAHQGGAHTHNYDVPSPT